jgi:tetratricopeptide (TPR) repeat protein
MKIYYIGLLLLFSTVTFGQKSLEKANDLYKKKLYAAALPMYEKAYSEKQSASTRIKLANCYKILNKADKAMPLYDLITKDEKAKSEDFTNYAEVMIMLSRYEDSKILLNKALKLDNGLEKAKLMLISCDQVKNVKPYFNDVFLKPYDYNTEVDENSPFILKNRLYFASDRKSGFNLLKQSSGIKGRDFINIYSSDLYENDSITAPKSFDKFNELNKNTSNVSFMYDGSEAYFSRNSSTSSKAIDVYNMQVFGARSFDSTISWRDINALPFSTSDVNLMYPCVSRDGKYLFYVSERSSGFGGLDIYYSKRDLDTWSAPINLGPKVNTASHEGFPFAAYDGKLFFCSKGHPGYGGYDIFYTTMDRDGQWSSPINVGMPINSCLDDISIYLDRTEKFGVFATSRFGNGDDLILFKIGVPFVESKMDTISNGFTIARDEEKISTTKQSTEVIIDKSINTEQKTELPKSNISKDYESFITNGAEKSLNSGEIYHINTFKMDTLPKVLEDSQLSTLDEIYKILKKNKNLKFDIIIQVKQKDSAENDITYSRKWSKKIKEYLIDKGINEKLVYFKSIGSTPMEKLDIEISNRLFVKIK